MTVTEAVLLRIFVGEDDWHGGRPVHAEIVDRARTRGLAGATALCGPLGFGSSGRVRSDLYTDAPATAPVVIEIIDAENNVRSFLPMLQEVIASGLVTMETVRARVYGSEGSARAEQGVPTGLSSGTEVMAQPTGRGGEKPTTDSGKSGRDAEIPHEAVLLRIFTGTDDRWGTGPLYSALLHRALQSGLSGATVVRGFLGFGRSRRLHRGHLIPLTEDLPVIVEIVDDEDRITAFLPVVDEMMESGLVTIEKAQVLRYGRKRMGLFARLRQEFSAAPNAEFVEPNTERSSKDF